MSLLAVQGGATGTGTVTLLAPVTNTDRTITLPDATGTVLTTATAGVPINGPAFSYYLNTAQTGISAGVFTKVLYDTQIFNATSSMFSSSRFTPTVAGYYQINGSINPGGTLTTSLISIFKNGSRYTDGTFFKCCFCKCGDCIWNCLLQWINRLHRTLWIFNRHITYISSWSSWVSF